LTKEEKKRQRFLSRVHLGQARKIERTKAFNKTPEGIAWIAARKQKTKENIARETALGIPDDFLEQQMEDQDIADEEKRQDDLQQAQYDAEQKEALRKNMMKDKMN